MAAEKEGNKETTQSTTQDTTTSGSKKETSEASRQDTSKQQTKSGDTMKSGQQETEGASSTKEGKSSGKEHRGGNRNSPKYYTYSYSKSYRNINGDTYSTERYVVDTPNMKFTAEKPEDSPEFTIEYEKGGKAGKDKKVIPESIEDDLHKMMSRVNTELNFFNSDFWYSPFSRRWSPFKSIEREFEKDFQSLFEDIESEFGGRKSLEGGQHKQHTKKQLKGSPKSEESHEEKQEKDDKKGSEEREHEEDTGRTGQTRTTRV